jgi:hypothetical protein
MLLSTIEVIGSLLLCGKERSIGIFRFRSLFTNYIFSFLIQGRTSVIPRGSDGHAIWPEIEVKAWKYGQ